MKYGITITLLVIGSITASGQLKVHSDGTASVGTTASWSGYALRVHGGAGIMVTNGTSTLRLSSSSTDAIIGSNSNRVSLWTNGTIAYNDLYIEDLTEYSDSTYKTDIAPLQDGLSFVMELEPKSYYRINGLAEVEAQKSFGFLAQDVALVKPELVSYGVDSTMGVNTTQIIPYLVLALQEQQVIIDSLFTRVNELEKCCEYDTGTKSAESNGDSSSHSTSVVIESVELGQNRPNPFKETTVIPYKIPESTQSAQIIIYDMRGQQLEKFELNDYGSSSLIIEGGTFKAGMYIYALIVDGVFIESKQMILSK